MWDAAGSVIPQGAGRGCTDRKGQGQRERDRDTGKDREGERKRKLAIRVLCHAARPGTLAAVSSAARRLSSALCSSSSTRSRSSSDARSSFSFAAMSSSSWGQWQAGAGGRHGPGVRHTTNGCQVGWGPGA